MNGEGFAFFHWTVDRAKKYGWAAEAHGWSCRLCRIDWKYR